jgi:hypothetical protein
VEVRWRFTTTVAARIKLHRLDPYIGIVANHWRSI